VGETGQMKHSVSVEIGEMPILLRTADASFRRMLESRYAGFLASASAPHFQFDIDLAEPIGDAHADKDVEVRKEGDRWLLERGDFRAQWDPEAGLGHVFQTPNPYSIDSVLRIVHTLILARRGGFLLHAASGIRDGKAFLFTGVSGAGKTTISRLAPPDVTLLTDEVSYVRRCGDSYQAYGTPFAGELARVGENRAAPISKVFLLEKGKENREEQVDPVEATRALLRNILFFSEDSELVKLVFKSACEFVERIPVRRLVFAPDRRVWEMIG
jgi:hypothetical protein